jgi:hypothetical protein
MIFATGDYLAGMLASVWLPRSPSEWLFGRAWAWSWRFDVMRASTRLRILCWQSRAEMRVQRADWRDSRNWDAGIRNLWTARQVVNRPYTGAGEGLEVRVFCSAAKTGFECSCMS